MTCITIVDVKIFGFCSKHRTKEDKILTDKNGVLYKDEEIACIECEWGVQNGG